MSDRNDIELARQADASPFDTIKLAGEHWSARDLMPLLGYDRWENFTTAIERARATAENQGFAFDDLFRGVTKKGAGRPMEDFDLSRFACYLIAMNGDPRKPEVAAAQAYFAIRTREAETAPAPTGRELMARAILEAADTIKELDAKVAELEPKAEFYDDLMDANGCYSMESTAKALGYGRNILFKDLRRLGILQGNNLPYQRHAHHFKVIPGTYTNRKTGELVPTATTWVRPTGLEYLRRKLTQAVEAVQYAEAQS